jgi:hypothetical protein
MTHLTEEELVEIYYGGERKSHLDQCAACQGQFEEIESALNAFNDLPVPEPPPFTWREPFFARLLRQPAWLLAPALAAGLFAAFFLGRASNPRVPAAIQLADTGRERILLVTLGAHLERSQMVLLELANGDRANFPAAQERARNLIGENRLYRQTTLYSGDRNYTALLDELDRVLTAIANAQSNSSTADTEQIERLLFKIRVTDSNLEKGTEKL